MTDAAISGKPTPRERLIVALDARGVTEAEQWIETLGDTVQFFKVGMELVYGGGGLDLIGRLVKSGKHVFVDLKLHDIPNTVERATARIAELGANFLTIHAYPQTMRAALAGAKGSGLKLLGVSVLTSCDDSDLVEAGYAFSVRALVERRAAQAQEIGVAGVVASPAEAAMLRAACARDFLLVTPGIRSVGAEIADQKRVATAGKAIADGADYLVVGRPVTQSPDPRATAEAIVAEIAAASNPAPRARLVTPPRQNPSRL